MGLEINESFFNAIVVNNDDSNRRNNNDHKKGRIQVRVIPYMIDVPEAHLPWYDPIIGAGNSTHFDFCPPKVGSNIVVVPVTKTLRNGYYLWADHIEGFFDYSKVETLLGNVSELSETTYSNIHFSLRENGNIEFEHITTGEYGILLKNGSYIFWDSNGKMVVYGKDQEIAFSNDNGDITLKANGQVSINNGVFTVDP